MRCPAAPARTGADVRGARRADAELLGVVDCRHGVGTGASVARGQAEAARGRAGSRAGRRARGSSGRSGGERQRLPSPLDVRSASSPAGGPRRVREGLPAAGPAGVPADAPGDGGDQRQRADQDDEVRHGPEAAAGLLELPLQDLDLRDRRAGHAVLGGDLVLAERLVLGQVDRDAVSTRPSWTRSSAFQVPSTGIGSVVRYAPSPVRSRALTTRPSPCHEVICTHAGRRRSRPGPAGR